MKGEGGTFSTYSLLSRYMNITNRDPREASLVRLKRHASGDLETAGRAMRKGIESSRIVRGILKTMGVMAVSMVLSDGVLTPAQSVLGAVQGARVVNPNLSRGAVIGITDAVLVLLFVVQPFGITKITYLFSPIVIVWLGFNAVFGVYNLVNYDASVFKAFNPGYAFMFLIHHGDQGWRNLGGILLAFTGVEALFADLGAFSRRAVQLSWLCYTFPCLILAYVGQAAYISVHPEGYANPFFEAAPPGTIYPALIIAILAANCRLSSHYYCDVPGEKTYLETTEGTALTQTAFTSSHENCRTFRNSPSSTHRKSSMANCIFHSQTGSS